MLTGSLDSGRPYKCLISIQGLTTDKARGETHPTGSGTLAL